MKGNIYSDQTCPECGKRFRHEEKKQGLFCPNHQELRAYSLFYVKFGRLAKKRTRTYEQAARLLNAMRHETDEGKFDKREYATGNPLAASTALQKWLNELTLDSKRKTISVGTLKSYRPGIKHSIEFFKDKNIKKFTTGDIIDYSNWSIDKGLSRKTVYNDVQTLGLFFNNLVARNELNKNDSPSLPTIRYTMERRKIIDLELQDLILSEIKKSECQRAWFGIAILASHPNVRPGELLKIDECDIDHLNRMVLIRFGKECSHRDKVFHLMDDEFLALKALTRGFPNMALFRHEGGVQGCTDGQRFGKRYLYKCWIRACEVIGLEGVPLYPGTKHTTTTAIANAVGPAKAQQANGNTTNKAFSRYWTQSKTAEIEILSIRDSLLRKSKGGTQVVHKKRPAKKSK